MKCPYCGKEVANTAKTCPRCCAGLVKETPAPDDKRQVKTTKKEGKSHE